VAYANKYYQSGNSCFYTASADCTNFVSQCIWAAYGGWTSSGSTSTMTTNINNRKRMMSSSSLSNWFGHANGGGTPWESVEGLWNFVTGNPSEGPKATGYNNNGLYTGVSPGFISVGNVLQFWSSSLNVYRHSVYVVQTATSSVMTYADITVAAHTTNGKFTVADKIAGFGGSNCKMRRLAFGSANFNQ
jgi:hypothetical protein